MKRKLLIALMQEYTHLLELEQALYDHKSKDLPNYYVRNKISPTELKNLGIMIRKKMIALEDDLMGDRVYHMFMEIENRKKSNGVNQYGFDE